MALQQETENQTGINIDQLIKNAVHKLGVPRENDICPYIPVSSGGHIHHFTMKKMKRQLPVQLADMIQKFIIESEKPLKVRPKKRAPRGSRKRKEFSGLSRADIQKMLQLAVIANDKELVRKLMPKRELKAIQKELIASIKQEIVDKELWACYAEAVEQADIAQ